MRKALEAGADAVVFDLEDSVAPTEKETARATVGRVTEDLGPGAVSSIHVRINNVGGGYDLSDLTSAATVGLGALRLPKCESAADVVAVADWLDSWEQDRGRSPAVRLYPTIESARGVQASFEIASASDRVAALVFGPADFAASIGLFDPPFEAMLLARSTLVLASAASGIGRPVDGAYLHVKDLEGLRVESRRSRHLGFGGKSAIHPDQVPVLHEVFTPTADEVEAAEKIIEAGELGDDVAGGRYVDPPVLAQAEALIALARHVESKDD